MNISSKQFNRIDNFIKNNGRKIDIAKWNYLFNNAPKEHILRELLKYQNEDGGFGNGLEADILMPNSSSIASTEAILCAYNYELDCSDPWFKKLLKYFEKTASDEDKVLSFWEKVTSDVENYPHGPWWNYKVEDRFSPNPCAVVATALIKYGSESQKTLGEKIVNRSIDFINGEEICTDHDCYSLQTMVEVLKGMNLSIIDEKVEKRIEKRILDCLCTDYKKWGEYVAQPLNLVDSPKSPWYNLILPYIEENLNYWMNTLNDHGYWQPNFSWGIDSEEANRVTTYWKAYIAVNRMKILNEFGKVKR